MAHAQEPSTREQEKATRSCPVDHSTLSKQKTAPVVEPVGLPIELDEGGVWHIRGFEETRSILRSGDTKQAGFGAEQIDNVKMLKNKPILYQEGKVHHQQRKQTARFFTPKTVGSYRQFIEALADELVGQLKQRRRVDLSNLSLALAVPVAARVVGLTSSTIPGMDKRLEAFFHQPSTQGPESALSKWLHLRKLQALLNQVHTLSFYFFDVQPAIRVRKRQPQDDVISHLLTLKYSNPEILTECITYAAAGMATTREFISTAAWHFLEQPALKARYLEAPEEERFEMLHEILRLEPVVGHLYRRATSDITLASQGKEQVIPEGALIDIHIYSANADESVVGENPLALCPERSINSDRVPSMLMGFGDGAHRCPGSFLAIQETDVFLQRLLALETLRIEGRPSMKWNDVTTGYEIREFHISLN